MKQDTHPTYFPDAKIVCACGKKYIVGSTLQEISVEVCANCHPFYTGKQKLLDTARRVEKFEERKKKGKEMMHAAKVRTTAKRERKQQKEKEEKEEKEEKK